MEIQPIKMSKRLLIYIQFIYVMAYIPVGIGIIMLARGIGINISFSDSLAVIASMAVSWTTGYLAIFTPGGLGVRECSVCPNNSHCIKIIIYYHRSRTWRYWITYRYQIQNFFYGRFPRQKERQ